MQKPWGASFSPSPSIIASRPLKYFEVNSSRDHFPAVKTSLVTPPNFDDASLWSLINSNVTQIILHSYSPSHLETFLPIFKWLFLCQDNRLQLISCDANRSSQVWTDSRCALPSDRISSSFQSTTKERWDLDLTDHGQNRKLREYGIGCSLKLYLPDRSCDRLLDIA